MREENGKGSGVGDGCVELDVCVNQALNGTLFNGILFNG